MHYDENQPAGSQHWMDTQSSNATPSYGMTVGLTGDFTLDFKLRPQLVYPLCVDGSLPSNLHVRLHLEAEGINPFPLKNVWIEWIYGSAVIHSDAPDNVNPGVITFDLSIDTSTIPSGTEVVLKVHFEVRAQTTFTLYTDTSSRAELNLLPDNDYDGDPDSTDPDDDNDGFTDEQELAAGTDSTDPTEFPTPDGDVNDGDDRDGGSSFPLYLLAVIIIIVLALIVLIKRRR